MNQHTKFNQTVKARCKSRWFGMLCILAFPQLVFGSWPTWRGPDGNGIAKETSAPLHWSATEHLRWRLDLPEPGNSSPVIWKTRLFLTQAVGARRTLLCVNARNGRIEWQQGTVSTGPETTHESNPYCSSSAVTDGEHVFAWYGSAGVYCYSMSGKVIWQRDLGKQEHDFGYASSPILYSNLCVLNFGPGKRSFLIALDQRTGRTVWQVDQPRYEKQYDAPPGSFSTPVLARVGTEVQLIHAWPARLCGLNPRTGQELWFCTGLDQQTLASPVVGDGIAVAMAGFRGQAIAARIDGRGDVTETHRLWRKKLALISTGVIREGYLYTVRNSSAMCLDLKTGEKVWEERLTGTAASSEAWASPVLVKDLLYIPTQSGDTVILRASPKYEVIAVNSVGGDKCNASVAVSEGRVFLRTAKALWCFGD